MQISDRLNKLGWTFSVTVLTYLGFLALINVLMFVPGNPLSAMGHFDFVYTGETHNLIHELVFALVIGTAAVGLLSQLWKPKEQFAGQLVALIAWVAMIVTAVLTKNWVPQPLFIIFGGLTLIATIFHPAGRGLFNWIRTAKINKILLTLVIVAAVPLLSFAVTNINLQRAGTNMHQNESGEFLSLFGHKIPTHGDSQDTTMLTDIETIKQRYANYTVAQAEREGYKLDSFCLDAASFGQPVELGAMGYHATNEALLRGPIAAERPQAIMFDAEGRVLGVEYEIMSDAVSEPPQLFGQTFKKLPPHAGVEHEHYALHVWFIDNPNGQFADFNPTVSCPTGSTPSQEHGGHGAASTDDFSTVAANDVVAHDEMHAVEGHYRNVAALSFIIIVVGLLASLQPLGWRLAAWITGLLPIALGLASIVLPEAESSFESGWAFMAIAWGIAFIATAELTRHRAAQEIKPA